MPTGERSTAARPRSRTRLRARATCAAILLVFPLLLTACNEHSVCELAQKVSVDQGNSGVDSPKADEEYRSLAQEWAAPGASVDKKAQAAAVAMLAARRNGNILAYGAAKKTFDFYVEDQCGYDVSLAQLR